jgi:thiol-disulfide isomerase/thioredoxin
MANSSRGEGAKLPVRREADSGAASSGRVLVRGGLRDAGRARRAIRALPWLDVMEFEATVLRPQFLLNARIRRSAACLTLAFALGGAVASSSAANSAARHPLLGKPAPEFVQRLFAGTGRNFRLSERRGEVVVVGFWTSWCGSCRTYLDRLAKLDATYGRAGLVVVGISLDDNPGRAIDLANAVGAKFRNGVDETKTLGRRFAVPDVPLTLLVDRAGVVRYAHGELDAATDADLVAELRQLLDE